MPNHAELIDKLEKATEGSRELDAAIFRALGAPLPDQFASLKVDLQWQPDGTATMPVGEMQVRYNPPAYTTSIDAIVALIERKLPGRESELVNEARAAVGKAHALHVRRWKRDEDGSYTHALALALCIALLRALQHQGGTDGLR